jgi:pyridoxal phosphate enzyme (YggS family)
MDQTSIAANLQRINDQIADICAHCGRQPTDIALMAVSKMHPAEAIAEACSAGQRLFGENRVQEFAAKAAVLAALPQSLPPEARFHLIGPLQNNKTTRAAELFHAVDSLDSFKTAARLNTAAAALGKTLPVLLEVKLSPEDTKHGIAPDALPALLHELTSLTNLRATGLMTVPPHPGDSPLGPETARPFFQHLRRLRDDNSARHPSLTQLSMGMSNDFAVAIQEGSTTVRIGTAIFGHRGPQT